MKPLSKADIFAAQRCVRAATQCCLIITLSILYDQFNITDKQAKVVIDVFREELKFYRSWVIEEVERANADFRKAAKTFKGAELEVCKNKKYNRSPEAMMINSEMTCLYIMLRIIRVNLGANYKQLYAFLDLYDEFNVIYGEGKQASMHTLNHELYELTGFDILGVENDSNN